MNWWVRIIKSLWGFEIYYTLYLFMILINSKISYGLVSNCLVIVSNCGKRIWQDERRNI